MFSVSDRAVDRAAADLHPVTLTRRELARVLAGGGWDTGDGGAVGDLAAALAVGAVSCWQGSYPPPPARGRLPLAAVEYLRALGDPAPAVNVTLAPGLRFAAVSRPAGIACSARQLAARAVLQALALPAFPVVAILTPPAVIQYHDGEEILRAVYHFQREADIDAWWMADD